MRKNLLILLLLVGWGVFSQKQTVTYSITPATFEETNTITITFNGSSINEGTWGVTGNALYLWAWSYDLNDATELNCPSNGTWTSSNELNRLTYNSGNDTYSITFVPTTFYNRVGIGKIGFLVKNKTGSGQSQDIFAEVGTFQVTLNTPSQNSTTILASGGSLNITATNTNGVANYNLKSNGVSINTASATASYSFAHTNITGNQNYELEVTQGTTTIVKKFAAVVNPMPVSETIPAGLVDGINYNANDATKATLVLDAPFKDFVYVAGSFNNWQPTNAYAMKKDATAGSTKFWLELTGLTGGTNYTYQYWVGKESPLANSPKLVKTADPYSTLVLSPFDDPSIPSASFPNIPAYPVGQEREVTWFKTGQTPYAWSSATTSFVKPAKEKLVVYEVLVRDFDARRSYQDLIDRIDYFKNLKVNAIQLMPVMEFEGNESWGYNTSFHMALDKFYGTPEKLKEFIDLCHQNGIAVILDIALNHAFGRNPMVRMWMNDADGDGWGSPTSENPYFNTVAKHSYSVGEDFNHQQPLTQNYVKRVVEHWIKEFKIDGFRWDLTKGFTQNAQGSDAQTNAYQQDRVDVLKKYADFSWAVDPTHYVIFEHLGGDSEEREWANYKDGIMMWGKMTDEYNELSMGWANKNISRMSSASRGFTKQRLMGYPESHDEERLMYKNLQFGNSTNPAHDVKNLSTALSRMSAIGAVSLLVPGPKMIWHFGELGWEQSIYTCNNGTVNTPSDATNGDCKLDKKPQPQWTGNWLGNSDRSKIYNDWAKMISLKINEPVFLGDVTISSANSVTPNIKITNANLASTDLKDVLIVSNFGVVTSAVATGFQYTGTWFDLMDNTEIVVSDVNQTITLQPGQFKILGNKKATLAIEDFEKEASIRLFPNPASNYFTLSVETTKVEIYSISGQKVKEFKANQSVDQQFSIGDLTKGFYFVKAYNAAKQTQVLKLIKD
ncbi:alpha-amylase family glycosyl hydrolase [Flavobacterium sp. TSSA_36]|uniref:alpha-amylase family glycosyl hydrolase n=1 Tax=Flavobacterium sp. TSSA_36 TaxID=3447669 RepID=UPI003F4111FF